MGLDLETAASSKVTKKNKQTKGEAAANGVPAGNVLPFSTLKVHKNENFFGFDFEFCIISMLVLHK